MVSRARVRRIRDRLRELYGRPVAPPHGHGLDELILTVLSQSTNDRNRDVAFMRLRDRFGSWEAVRDAPTEEVEAAIRPGGISKIKSVRIQQILRALPDPMDGPHLRDQDFLTSLPGVGRKTAACVRLFAYGERDWACSARRRRSRSCTTRCSRSHRAGRSSSSTSTCFATGAGPATRAARTVMSARCCACARLATIYVEATEIF
jgi:endonuclease III-like uncharacterized protein